MIRKVTAYILLVTVYGFTLLVVTLSKMIPRRAWKPTGRIMVTGTFHNPGWYLSHVGPLARSGVKEVILVVDEPQIPLEGVRFVCWPRWVSKLLSRPCARAIWLLIAGLHCRPDLYMGYHLGPGACTTLVVGRLMGRPTCYQMTGGPVEIAGGGIDSTDGIGAFLGRPSRLIEALAIKVVRQFELVVVRGDKAKRFLAARGIKESVAIITGSVNGSRQLPRNDRDIHLIYVGRLSPIKQLHQFITIVDAIKHTIPNIQAAIVGDGPLKVSLCAYSEELSLSQNIEFFGKMKDVESLIIRSRIFVLTSKSEGLSIAMAEAMSAGVVPIVADVGELSDLVTDGVNGYLVEPNCISEYTEKVRYLLQNQALWQRLSCEAIKTARSHCDIEVISQKWQQHLRDTIVHASGSWHQDILNCLKR